MRIPKIPIAFVSALGAISAWYAWKKDDAQQLLKANAPTSSPQTHSLSTTPALATVGHEPNKKVLTADNDELFSGAVVVEGPLVEDTDDCGRKILSMMTPDQATGRLRKNEQSFLVRRGQGVIRYDLVQLPSNDPLEDDHEEMIVEVPTTVAASEKELNSDWMFWGVYDGHS
jgi:pyruvate dehydrogenase phosphatase